MKAAVITVSDRGAAGERVDESGPILRELLSALPSEVVEYRVVPDEQDRIAEAVRAACDAVGPGVVLTSGGTGLSPRDVTPEAVSPLLEAECPGGMESLSREGRKKTPMASLSRGVAGRVGAALVVTLPGSPRAVRESWEVLGPLLKSMLEGEMLL